MMNLENVISAAELAKKASHIKKIFFYRICGAGMGPAAVLLKQAGYNVEGADTAFYPPMSTYLQSTQIPLFQLTDMTPEKMKSYDLIVVGNSVSGKSEQARQLEKLGVPLTSFPSALGTLLLRHKQTIGICGTHGKTTTTYFLAQLLEKCGEEPGYLVGGIIEGRDPARVGKSPYFPIEGDEYDSGYFHKISKFRLYECTHLILTSLEFDHADIFASVEKIEDEFRAVLPHLKGHIVLNTDYPSNQKLLSEYQNKSVAKSWLTYGEKSAAGPRKIQSTPKGSEFELLLPGENDRTLFKTSVQGEHNVLNLAACLLLLKALGFSTEKLKKAAQDLGMVKRRQELRGTYKGMPVIDDFAHHPRAITVTLEALKKIYPQKKMVTVFEPISATARSDVFQESFAESLSLSDEVIIAQAHLQTTAIGKKDLDVQKLTKDLQQRYQVVASVADSLAILRKKIEETAHPEKLLVILSNRTCLGLWESDFVQQLKK